jgi:hypothetical protein
MFKPFAQPRQLGATVLVLSALTLFALPATGVAAPPAEGPGSPLTVSPSPVIAPATTVGYNGQALEVEIANPGEEAAIDKVTLEGPEPGEFFSNGSDCSNLGEGQKCHFFFGLKPGSAGLKQATMVVSFQGGRSAESFPVSGEAVEPELQFSPSSYDFGLQRANRETASAQLQLTNVGAAPVELNKLEIQGDRSVFWTGDSDCWSGALSPQQSCSVEVNFNPHDRVGYEAELRAVANGSAFSALLSGQGGGAVVASTDNPFGFGAATVGSESEVRAVTIANTGDLPAGFFIAVVAGGDSGSFRLLDENCTTGELLPAGSCTAHVRFAPQGPGHKAARLALFGDGDDGTMVFLEGEGVAPKVAMTPTGFDFGALLRGSRGSAHSFGIRNEGSTPVSIGAASIVGANLSQFQITGDECAGVSLGFGQECRVRVRFAPTSAGAKHASLRVAGEAGAFTAALAGSGTATSSKRYRARRAARKMVLWSRVATR